MADVLKGKAGYLNKWRRKWQKRYFVLKDGFLYYYETQNSGEPKGRIQLQFAKIEESSGDLPPNCFVICTPNKKKGRHGMRRFMLEAFDAEKKREWIEAILAEVASTEERKEHAVTGYLQKWANRKKTWQKRWFALIGSKLAYYNKADDEAMKGYIDLARAYLIDRVQYQGAPCFQIVSIITDGTPQRVCDSCVKKNTDNRKVVRATENLQKKEDTLECPVCGKKFGLTLRKYHCHVCGRVVCSDCSNRKIPMQTARSYYLQPETDQDWSLWLGAVRDNCGMRDVVKSGIVAVKRNKEWHRMFVVLRRARFLLYEHVIDFVQNRVSVSASLSKAVIVSYTDKTHGPCLKLTTTTYAHDEFEDSESEDEKEKGENPNHSHRDRGDRGEAHTESFVLDRAASLPKPENHGGETSEENIDHDVEELSLEDLHASLCIAIPEKVFEVPLILAAERNSDESHIPIPVSSAIEWLQQHSAEDASLYLNKGPTEAVNKLISAFDSGVRSMPESCEPGAVTEFIKEFLARCPDNLFTNKYASVVTKLAEEEPLKAKTIKKVLVAMPEPHKRTLRCIVDHLRKALTAQPVELGPLCLAFYPRAPHALAVCIREYESIMCDWEEDMGGPGSPRSPGRKLPHSSSSFTLPPASPKSIT